MLQSLYPKNQCPMKTKLSILFMFFCASCAGQSTLATPADLSQQVLAQQTPVNLPTRPATTIEPRSPVFPGQATDPANELATPPSTRVMGPLTAKSEFQHFAEEAAGRPLQVYGRQLFDEVPTTFAPADNIPVPADYVIGPGDELLIRAWGKIDLDSRVTVDRNGQISLPKIGTLSVAGVRYEELESHLRFTIGNLYKDFELNVTLGRLRSIQIYVLGSARQPGLYTVSSLSTLVNALFASGGPSATGSMRHIQLRRADQLVRDFDIYDLVRSGDKSHDLQLLPGDVIYISPVGPQIAVLGSVNEPGIYELRGDTTIASALQFSGGLTSLAGTDRVLLERIEDHRARRVDQFGLDASGMQRLIQDGDVLRVFPLSPRFENAVTLHGNVSQPGRYAWHEGMRVSDLIPTRDFLVTRMYWNKQNHMPQPDVAQQFRSRPAYTLEDQFNDQSGGAPLVQAEKDSTAQFFEKQNNQSEMERPDQHATPRTYQRVQDQKADLTDGDHTSAMANIGRNSAEINWEYAVIERLDEQDLSTHLIPFRLADAIDNHASPDNQILKAGDIVTIFSRADLELPIEKHAAFVRVGGEVNAPGMYRVKPGETLREVVEQAGGLTSHSYLYASLFTRVSTRKAQEDQLQRSADEMQRELISRYANASPQAGQTGADQQAQLALQQAALAKLTSIKPTGRIVLAMQPSASSLGDIPDFSLEDGDTFYIPPRFSTVQVTGAVYNANAFRQEPGKRLMAYLNEAGGATREADQRRIFVIRADGSVVSRQSRRDHAHGNFDNLKLLPGDAIVVPEKIRVSSWMNNLLQATQFASQSAVTAAALSVVK